MSEIKSLQTAKAKNWLAALVNSSDDVVISKSLDGVILSWNRAAERVFGFNEAEAVGKHISLIIPSDRLDEEYVILGRVREGQGVDHFETVRRAKDGRLIDISLTVSPIYDDDGVIVGISKIARDITSLRASQRAAAHLAAIVDSSEDAILSKTLDGVITSWNTAASRIFGFTPEEAIGSHITMLIPPDYLQDETKIISKVRAGERVEHFETVRRHKDGRLFDVSLTVSPIRNEKGEVVGASKIARDISDQKRTRTLVEDASRRRDEFLANMSHELRTPMNAIIGLSHIISRSDSLTAKEQKAVTMLRQSADGLLMLINDLLDFAKMDQSEIAFASEEFNLREVSAHVADLLRVKASEKKLPLQFAYDKALGDLFVGDGLRLQQVLINLVGNAVKFTENGQVCLSVSRAGNSTTAGVAFEITDTGIGISPEKQSVIFEKFTQADATMTRRYGGTGLGLSITKTLVEQMGGAIELLSTPGLGSTFTVTLPLKPSENNIHSQSDAPPERANKNVLIVDDYEPNVMVISSIIEDLGYSFDVAYNGLEATRMALTSAYDVILMDVQMPAMDGFEATRRIRALEIENGYLPQPIIAVTAHVRATDRKMCLDAGMTDFIPKPFEPTKVSNFLAKFVPQARPAEAHSSAADPSIIRFSDVRLARPQS